MNKAIERVESYKTRVIGKALARAKEEYHQARMDFADSGYDRYFNKMNRKEAEIEELEAYLERDAAIDAAIVAKYEAERELKKIKAQLNSKLEYIMADMPECAEKERIRKFANDELKGGQQ